VRAYRRLLQLPGVARQATVAVISRTTAPVLALTLLAAVRAEYGDYALGSLLVGTFAVSFAVAMPVTGRLTDAHSPRRILRVCLALNLLAFAGFITSLVSHAPPPLLVALAMLLGGSLPPVGAVTRSGWAILVPAPELPTAYALDAVINEAATILGPLLAAVVLVSAPPPAGLALAAVAVCVGSLGLPARVLAARRGHPAPRFLSWGPLRSARTRLLLAMAACTSFTAGAAVIGATTTAASLGRAGAAGVLLAVLGIGAVASAAAYGARRWRTWPLTHLTVLCWAGLLVFLAMATTCRSGLTCAGADGAPVAVWPAYLGSVVLFLVLGATHGPRDAVTQLLLARSARAEHRTEAFSWLATAGLAGFGVGTAVTGLVADEPGRQALIFVTPAVACAVALVLRAGLRRRDARFA
jgi:MFS family permease